MIFFFLFVFLFSFPFYYYFLHPFCTIFDTNGLICIFFAMLLLITLTDNQVGDAGATQLANALERNRTLTTLDLYCKHDMICDVVIFILNVFISI